MLGSFLGHVGLFFRSFFCSFFVLLFCSFFDRFGVPFGGVFGAKMGSKRVYVIFGFSLNVHWLLYVFCDLEGAIFVSFRDFFRFVFCIDFWSFFGSILGSFWEAFGSPNRSFLASIFG